MFLLIAILVVLSFALKYLNKKDAAKVKSYQHDLVLNGFEVGGGSIRIHDPEIP